MTSPILLLPGIGNSGAGHWQTLWAQTDASMTLISGQDWDRPICEEWVENLAVAVRNTGPDVILVAHSLGCLQLASWAQYSRTVVRGALLVAVPDPTRDVFPKEAKGFSFPRSEKRFAFPSMMIASSNDPYADIRYSQRRADAWGSNLINIGERGHINAASGLGDWPQGQAWLQELKALR